MNFSIETIPERTVAVILHDGPESEIENARRPLYRHLIMEELIGGPSAIRFRDDGRLDLLVGTQLHFAGDHVAQVEHIPEGTYAVADFEGPVADLPAARARFVAAVQDENDVTGPLLQVHLMDEIDGEIEQQFQLPVQG